jgi:hypothetical protein
MRCPPPGRRHCQCHALPQPHLRRLLSHRRGQRRASAGRHDGLGSPRRARAGRRGGIRFRGRRCRRCRPCRSTSTCDTAPTAWSVNALVAGAGAQQQTCMCEQVPSRLPRPSPTQGPAARQLPAACGCLHLGCCGAASVGLRIRGLAPPCPHSHPPCRPQERVHGQVRSSRDGHQAHLFADHADPDGVCLATAPGTCKRSGTGTPVCAPPPATCTGAPEIFRRVRPPPCPHLNRCARRLLASIISNSTESLGCRRCRGCRRRQQRGVREGSTGLFKHRTGTKTAPHTARTPAGGGGRSSWQAPGRWRTPSSRRSARSCRRRAAAGTPPVGGEERARE